MRDDLSGGAIGTIHGLDEDTPVRMADGRAFPIKEVMPGDRVVGWDVGRKLPIEAVVIANRNNGMQECVLYHLPLIGNDRVVAVPDHRVWGTIHDIDHPHALTYGLTTLGEYAGGNSAVILIARSVVTPEGRQALEGGRLPTRLADDPIGSSGSYRMACIRPMSKPASPVGMRPTRTLEVAHRDHLFVLANGLIVLNSTRPGLL